MKLIVELEHRFRKGYGMGTCHDYLAIQYFSGLGYLIIDYHLPILIMSIVSRQYTEPKFGEIWCFKN